ncbi:MAG: DUF2029 domain-containing protein [Candidatus Methanoplasma sp.]|jgi:hypothetical protein|nr:DUF2029 domain-containing protein [Candidatus Methanoplasma sp.]
MLAADNRVRRYQLVLGIVFAVASVAYLAVIHQMGIESEAMKVYFPYADELMRGSIPEMEYPPFALVFIAIPRLFASTPFGYNVAFVAEVFVFFLIGLAAMSRLAKRYNQSQSKIMVIYTVSMLLMLEFVLDRYDIFPAVLTLLSFYCLVTKNYVWAFALLSVATMTKLYPAVLFPLYLIPFFMNRDWSNVLKGITVFVAVATAIMLPMLLLNPDAAFHFLGYHMDRPLQIESTLSPFIYLASMMGFTDVQIAFGYGSDNLLGPWPDAVAPYLTPFMLAAVVAMYALYAYALFGLRRDRRDNENNRVALLSGAMVLLLMTFILAGKVFSTQYIIWLIPFVVFMLMTLPDRSSKNTVMVLSVLAIILTQLNFAVNVGISGGGEAITSAGVMIILARNIVMVILFAQIFRIVYRDVLSRKRCVQDP